MELTETGLVNYLGKYDYYLEKKQQLIDSANQYVASLAKAGQPGREDFASGDDAQPAMSAAEERRLKKEKEAEERRLRRRRESLEAEIERLEAEIESIQEQLQKPEVMTDRAKLTELSDKLTEDRQALDANYEQWLELQE